VLLHHPHAFEMLLMALLVQRGVRVFDPRSGVSIGFEKCVRLGREHAGLSDAEAGTLRAIDALRDDEQHWFNQVSEGLLYAHARAAVTLFDDLLARAFAERLADHLPVRVLPISSEPPRDLQLLINAEYRQIGELLTPGRRRRPDARARIRTLLAMEAHEAEEVRVSRKDVDRVERAIRAGAERASVFPRLATLGTEIGGEGVQITVRFSRTSGAPVRFIGPDDPTEAAAVRELDLQRKYHLSATDLAQVVGLTPPRAVALRRHLGIDEDDACRHDFTFGSQVHRQYSDNALHAMREALKTVDMEQIWRAHRPRRRAAGGPAGA
jgi:hypothetical protein